MNSKHIIINSINNNNNNNDSDIDNKDSKSNKNIKIKGTHNRYVIKQANNYIDPNIVRKNTISWTPELLGLSHFEQLVLLINLTNTLINEPELVKSDASYKIVTSEMTKKLKSYITQDNRKSNNKCKMIINKEPTYPDFPTLINPTKQQFEPNQQDISLIQLCNMLMECKLKCIYCKECMYIIYHMNRDKTQWTLDRIDNDKPHLLNNVVISCLACNLKRKRTNFNKFNETQFCEKINKL